LGDRALYLLSRMVELVNSRAHLTVQELLLTPDIAQLLVDVTKVRQVSERYAALIEALPAPSARYVVHPGDTLSRIAGGVYGDGSPQAWKRIYDANKAAIGADPSHWHAVDYSDPLDLPSAAMRLGRRHDLLPRRERGSPQWRIAGHLTGREKKAP
jgi:hypothetical protein